MRPRINPNPRSNLSRPINSRQKLWLSVTAIVVIIAGAVFADYWSAEPADISLGFVGRDACVDCHQTETQTFIGSDHDKAMDLATEETVLGDFNDVTFEHDGIVSRLYRDGERFMINTEGPTGEMEDFHVKYVFGVSPLQQYMVEFDRPDDMPENEISRVQVLRISWDTLKGEWFYLRPPDVTDKLEPDDQLHWTGIAQRWQTMCADCHSTNLKSNFDPASNRYHTTFSEMDVSCESCHGPGSLHIQLANKRSLFWDRRHGYGLAKLKGEDPKPQLDTCAPCHSRRSVMDNDFLAGNEYCNFYQLELLRPETYHGDGQIKDEVYVYGSFIQSKMYHKGIRCTDCHDPHSLKLKHPGNETCTSCHQHAAGKYDVPSHHHHAPGTAGAMCVNCHMPHTTYMEVDARRDHSLRIPRPDLSVQLGTPNACSHCHVKDQLKDLKPEVQAEFGNQEYSKWLLAAEQGNQAIADAIKASDLWCDQACDQWYGAERKRPYHFAEALVPFRRGDPESAQGMLELIARDDGVTPAIARATAISELAGSRNNALREQAERIAENVNESPILRAAAVQVFASISPALAKPVLLPLLDDESRLVRSEAARTLLSSRSFAGLTELERGRLERALEEVKDGLMVADDRSGAHMSWAMICEQLGRIQEAVDSYETAIRIEPTVTGPRTNYAALLERIVGQAAPNTAQNYLAKAQSLRKEELPLLARDAGLAPDNAALQYRYGLALYLNGQMQEAKERLERAVELEPDVPDFQLALKLLNEKLQSQ
ncbi:multiheme c-type cytochrome [Stieleria varia]|uniref:Tetratricopeptide repeat protein n=1 Tax=Stieleria varia TaxID=2528005 RepID=A0A5C6B906_9BACT|nr:multiheme c-type cytochrome [Stieleria varia]TWU07921.1 Tetratricopeptide repeat protein [Stieleria varia]